MFPLQTVLFPGGQLPLRIFETRYMDMAKRSLRDGSPFGVCLIVEGKEVGEPAIPANVGTLARIGEWDMPQLGLLHVVARAGERFRLLERRVQADGLALGKIERLPPERDAPVPSAYLHCARLLERLVDEQPGLFTEPHRLDSSAWVSARLAELLPLPLTMKQALLELDDGEQRLARISGVIRAGSREDS